MLRASRWSAVIVLGLCIVLGGCHRIRNEQTLTLSERRIADLEQKLARAQKAQQRGR